MLVWLVGVVPAAVVTVLRGRWLLFWCGWLTGGVIWFIGALIPDPDDSFQKRRWAAIGLVAMTAGFMVLGLFGARPSPVLGLDGRVLQSSVGKSFLFEASESCEPRPGGSWLCSRYDSGVSGTVDYRVRANGLGCWQGERTTPAGEVVSKHISGCVSLFDFVLG